MYEEQEEYEGYEGQSLADESLTDTSPRPFSEVPALWLKVTQMTGAFFAEEAPRASGSSTFVSVLVIAAIATISSMISSLISMVLGTPILPFGGGTVGDLGSTLFTVACCGMVGGVIGFYLGTGVNYLGARIFGGDGSFTVQTYLQALYGVPIGIVVALLSLPSSIPYLGCVFVLASLAVSIYAIVLNVRAIKAAHHLTTGRAVAAIFVPALVLAGIPCLVLLVLFLTAPAIDNIFENIILSI